jgi:hypothetical protein
MGHHRGVTDNKSPVDRVLDLFVYAPLGFAIEARKLLPDMIERGRQQVTGQVGMARVVGQFAVQKAEKDAGKAMAKAQKQAAGLLEDLGVGPSTRPDPRQTEPPANRPPATSARRPTAATTPSSAASPPATDGASAASTVSTVSSVSAVDVATLAIPDYDSLSASQVVPRLAGLSIDELEAVRDYEAGHRGRKTILNRVAQLQAQ